MNEYKPLKLDAPTIPAQGTTFVTGAKGDKKKGSTKAAVSGEYLKSAEWNAPSAEEQAKVIEARKKSKANDNNNESTSSSKSIKSLSKMLKSLEKSNRRSARRRTMNRQYLLQRGQATSRWIWICSRSTTPRLF